MTMTDIHTLFDLSGRTAIVTGGSRGIGRAIATGFAAAGARVVVASRSEDACAEVAKEIEHAGGESIAVATDLGDLAQVRQMVDRAVERFGGVDIIVNNAGTMGHEPVKGLTLEAWEHTFDVDLKGPVFLVQHALPHLLESDHAAVINIISAGALMFAPFVGTYNAAKAGLLSFTRTMAAELGSKGVRVNAIAPGTIRTDMLESNGEEALERMAKMPSLRRLGAAEELVGPALLLASDAGSYITGQVLLVDGGLVPH
jgi:NAD(P)-dependent dehydrogenase (short-subunit alcohol dehydrogenase family)